MVPVSRFSVAFLLMPVGIFAQAPHKNGISSDAYFRGKSDSEIVAYVVHLTKSINAGNYKGMPAIILEFVSGRVMPRRKSEAKLFATGVYDAKH
jgi:hypothetical protein